MKYYYTEKEIKQLLKQIVVLVDTREKENTHILKQSGVLPMIEQNIVAKIKKTSVC